MPLTILTYPNPLLARKSAPVTEITEDIRELVREMIPMMYDADGIGLAAPQVGRQIRLVVIDVSGPEKREDLLVLVNPRLTPVPEEGTVVGEEGCLSVTGYRANVKRYAKVILDAEDLDGNPVHREAEGLLAVCLQHEVDHLDGKLFIDRISRLKRSMFEMKLKKGTRQSQVR